MGGRRGSCGEGWGLEISVLLSDHFANGILIQAMGALWVCLWEGGWIQMGGVVVKGVWLMR